MSSIARLKARLSFIETMRTEGMPEDIARKVLRMSTTLTRLAEAQCNGDFPADNGARPCKQCSKCQQSWHPSFFARAGTCRECTLIATLARTLENFRMSAVLNGDPRGAVVKLRVPSGRTDDWAREGICVP